MASDAGKTKQSAKGTTAAATERCKYRHDWIEAQPGDEKSIICRKCTHLPNLSERPEAEATVRIREWVKPGDTLYTQLKSVSRSGMSRVIQVVKIDCSKGEPSLSYLGWNVAKALGWGYDDRKEGVKVGGCGMDMGFHLVYSLSHTLFGEYACLGPGKCMSSFHQGEHYRDYTTEKIHHDGYALNHKWL